MDKAAFLVLIFTSLLMSTEVAPALAIGPTEAAQVGNNQNIFVNPITPTKVCVHSIPLHTYYIDFIGTIILVLDYTLRVTDVRLYSDKAPFPILFTLSPSQFRSNVNS